MNTETKNAEATATAPADGTVQTPQAQPPALTVADLRNVRTIIDISSSRGAFRGNELKTVGEVFDKLDVFLKAVDAKAEEAKKEADKVEAEKSKTEEEKKEDK